MTQAFRFAPNIAIVTAIYDEEFPAVNKVFRATQTIVVDDHLYRFVSVPSATSGANHDIVICQLSMHGNINACAETSRICHHFPTIRTVIMCGIACGFPNIDDDDSNVQLGDVVVSESVIQHDFQKITSGGTEARGNASKADPTLIRSFQLYKALVVENQKPRWPVFLKDAIQDLGPGWNRPKLREGETAETGTRTFKGLIVSGDTLEKSVEHREEIRKRHTKALALEMEGAGVAAGAIQQRKDFFIVRGICDYGDSNKNDEWHKFAAVSAAAFTRGLIELTPRSIQSGSNEPMLQSSNGTSLSQISIIENESDPIRFNELPATILGTPIVPSLREKTGKLGINDELLSFSSFNERAQNLINGFDYDKALDVAMKFEALNLEYISTFRNEETKRALVLLAKIYMHWGRIGGSGKLEHLSKARSYIEMLRGR